MATTIQEPGECTPITDANAHNFQALVYEKAQDGAGIKLMGMVDWKTYLGFNEHKADNIANYIGINPLEYDISQPNPALPQNPPGTVLDRINHLANDCGLNITAQPISDPTQTLDGRITTLNDQINTPTTGIDARVQKNANDISDIQAELGSGGGGGGGSSGLTARVGDLETKVGYYNETGKTDSGLMLRVHNIENDVGHASDQSQSISATGLHLAVETNTEDIGVEPNEGQGVVGSGLKKRCKDIENVNNTQTTNISEIQNIVGTSTYDLQTKGTVSHRLDNIESGMSSVYKYVGDIINCYYDMTGEGGSQRWYVVLTGSVVKYFDEFTEEDNGNVYNINPSGESLVINNISYTKGTNIAFVYKSSAQTELKGAFDELGTAIDVSRIDNLEQIVGGDSSSGLRGDVSELQDKFITKNGTTTTWNSSNLDGVYLVVGKKEVQFSQPKLESFIGYFSNGACYVHNDIKIESTDSLFIFNNSGVNPTYIVEGTANDVQVYITQIG